MKYKCINAFCVPLVDDNGRTCERSGYAVVKKGSKWEPIENKLTLTGAEIRLESLNELDWIEISKDRLEKYFEVIECNEHRRVNVTDCDLEINGFEIMEDEIGMKKVSK